MNTLDTRPNNTRLPQLDIARGAAIIAMIIYHIIFDLAFFEIIELPLNALPMRLFQIVIASTFLFITGASSFFFYTQNHQVSKYLRRLLILGSSALLVTIGSWILFPSFVIIMGILHFITLATIFIVFLKNLSSKVLFVIAGLSLFIGMIILSSSFRLPSNWLLIFGIPAYDFQTLDYYPMFPWFGVAILGFLYARIVLTKARAVQPTFHFNQPLTWLGRHSLIIYLVHQPIILFILMPLFPDALLLL